MNENNTNIFIFSQKQSIFINFLMRIKLVRPIMTYGIRDPFTDKIICYVQECKSNLFIDTFVMFINDKLIGKDGNEVIEKLKRYGAIEEY